MSLSLQPNDCDERVEVDRQKAIQHSELLKNMVEDVGEDDQVIPIQINSQILKYIVSYIENEKFTVDDNTSNDVLIDIGLGIVLLDCKTFLKEFVAVLAERIKNFNVIQLRELLRQPVTVNLQDHIIIRKREDWWEKREEGWDNWWKCSDGEYCSFEPEGESFDGELKYDTDGKNIGKHSMQRVKCTKCQKTYDEDWCCRGTYTETNEHERVAENSES